MDFLPVNMAKSSHNFLFLSGLGIILEFTRNALGAPLLQLVVK